MTLTVEVHKEDGVLWGHVVELPGCFATGDDLDELGEIPRALLADAAERLR